jgi:hypothetical protein
MRSLRLNKLFLATALVAMAIGLGCDQSDQGSGSTSGSGSGAGIDYPPRCVWGEPDAGLTFPVCPAMFTSEFVGTVDGMPFHTKDSASWTGTSLPDAPPYQLSVNFNGTGDLDLEWGNPYIRGQWTKISGGRTMRLPGESIARVVSTDSEVLYNCYEYSFLYILHITGGELTGCSR